MEGFSKNYRLNIMVLKLNEWKFYEKPKYSCLNKLI